MKRWDRTHEALASAALALFSEHGFDATTTAQVAARAGVTEMTLFRHFPSKEALLLADPFDPVLADAVHARPVEEPPMTALTRAVASAWGAVPTDQERALRERLAIIAATPGLRGAVERSSAATTDALADALVERGVGRAAAAVAASAVIAGLGAALLAWAQDARGSLSDALASALSVMGGDDARP